MEKIDYICDALGELFPNNKGDLEYGSVFQLLVAVILSAQTTDIAVNNVTKELFKRYPDAKSLAKANIEDVKEIIKTIGLYNTKAKNIIEASKIILENNNVIEPDLKWLMSLPGVGRKTANVVLSEGFKIPRIAVDTHVFRVARRLELSSAETTIGVEEDLMKILDQKKWGIAHLRLLRFGRYICRARGPLCEKCPFFHFCTSEDKKELV